MNLHRTLYQHSNSFPVLSDVYRYGFNGKEQDHEIKGSGNIYDYGARIHDPRLSRWLVVAAYFKLYPGNSPYTFAMNNPVRLVDSDGNVVTIPDGTGGVITYTPGMSSDGLSKYAQATVNYLNSIANGEKGGPRLDKLTSSEVVYRVEINISESFQNLDKGGRTRYDFNSNEVFLEVAFEENEAFNLAALGDELAHAEQFDDGDLGFFESESNPGFGYSAGYDLDDEMASKRAAFEAIDGAGYKPSDTDPEGKYKSTEMLELISKGEDTEKAINKWARKSGYSTQFDAGGEKTGQSISGKQGIEKLSGREGVQRTVYREDGQTINNEY